MFPNSPDVAALAAALMRKGVLTAAEIGAAGFQVSGLVAQP
jgi:hypothetical protein